MFNIFDAAADRSLPIATTKRSQPSPAERLYRDLQAHTDSQAAILAEISYASSWAASPLAEFLLRMVEDNETRELEVLKRMSISLKDALDWSYSAGALPDGSAASERAETVKSVKELLRLERQRARTTRRLAKAYAGIDGGLQQTLLELSAAAAENNCRLLQLLLRRVKVGAKRTVVDGAGSSGPSARRNEDERQRLAA